MEAAARIRNFVIIAHIDHGKSTLADRLLELTGTVERRKLKEQHLDQMDLEREKGITIKMAPVTMKYQYTGDGSHFDRRNTQKETQKYAENEFLYSDLTYKIRGALFQVRKKIGLGHKEQVYHQALEIEFKNNGLVYESRKNIPILYEGQSIGTYQPDFVIEGKILIELKALPKIGRPQVEQVWSYLKGCEYKVALLVNYGSTDLEIKRIVYDLARVSASAEHRRQDAKSAEVNIGANDQIENSEYILNLIDTPGHVDFSYEVSRALAAVEGAVLLVDASQGIQAQTIANFHLARAEGLVVIPVVNKIDLPGVRVAETEEELVKVTGCRQEEILRVSGKTGEGVPELLRAVIGRVPPPAAADRAPRALIFDSHFDAYRGVIAHVRMVDGEFISGERVMMFATRAEAEILELGYFSPGLTPSDRLQAGEIGYIATGIKEPDLVRVGDTVTKVSRFKDLKAKAAAAVMEPLPGYREPVPVVFASVYPDDPDEYPKLLDALKKVHLNDAALSFEPEASDALGRGFRAGFLGMLHLEIVRERLKREHGLDLLFTTPSVAYRVKFRNGGERVAYSASRMPDASEIIEILEPWVRLEIIAPAKSLGPVMRLLQTTRAVPEGQEYLGSERIAIRAEVPLRDILVDFFDQLKSVTAGYGSFGYEPIGERVGGLARLDLLIAGVREDALSQVVPRERAYDEGRRVAAKLKELLPKQLFAVSIQAAVDGRVLARETLPAMKKDVTGYLYGGDRTRKMKLWKKQQRGKKRLREAGRVEIPPEVYGALLRRG